MVRSTERTRINLPTSLSQAPVSAQRSCSGKVSLLPLLWGASVILALNFNPTLLGIPHGPRSRREHAQVLPVASTALQVPGPVFSPTPRSCYSHNSVCCSLSTRGCPGWAPLGQPSHVLRLSPAGLWLTSSPPGPSTLPCPPPCTPQTDMLSC